MFICMRNPLVNKTSHKLKNPIIICFITNIYNLVINKNYFTITLCR